MRNLLILAAAASALLAPHYHQENARTRIPLRPENTGQPPVRRKSKTANKIRVFMGYASDRKGKGQKKRDASARRVKGWM